MARDGSARFRSGWAVRQSSALKGIWDNPGNLRMNVLGMRRERKPEEQKMT